jgi:cyclophilin family peptidyl-prolyl cis-trans isomerase
MNVTIDGKEEGTIELGLFRQYAPKTVELFIENIEDQKYGYMGTMFHRIVKNFMIQVSERIF